MSSKNTHETLQIPYFFIVVRVSDYDAGDGSERMDPCQQRKLDKDI